MKEAELEISSQKAEVASSTTSSRRRTRSRAARKRSTTWSSTSATSSTRSSSGRNDELSLLYEKIKIQQSILNKGQTQYRDRVNELRILKIKLGDMKRELGGAQVAGVATWTC